MLELLKNKVGEWLSGGPQGDVVVSSRVRLARNIAGYPFLTKISPQEVTRIEELLREKILSLDLSQGLVYYRVSELDALLREVLVERQLMARDLAGATWPGGVAFSPDERLSLMINEEDHLRVQVIYGGFQLQKAWQEVNRVDDALAEVVPFAFSAKYGYLAACPTNVGTGMRASVMVHLPAMVMAREMDKLVELAQRHRLAVRGLYGEGTPASADFYQISNQVTLGITEQDILEQVSKAIWEVISIERSTRENLSRLHSTKLQGRLALALEMLANATAISSEEALHLLSQVRMGVEMNLLKDVRPEALNELMLLTLPAHLQTMEGRRLASLRRNKVRADYIKRKLHLN